MVYDCAKRVADAFSWGKRHTQTLLLFLCMALSYALRFNLSVAIVAMTDRTAANRHFIELHWDEPTKSTVLSSFCWGYILTQVYAGQIAQKYGGKVLLAAALGICGFLTIITPAVAIHGGAIATCINRMIQGMAQGVLFPAINVLLSKWVPTSEKARLSSFVFSGLQAGTLAMLATTGILANSVGGWPSVFYVSGVLTLVWVLVWSLIGANNPAEHQTISETEKKYIMNSLNNTSKKNLPTPWAEIFKSIPMWTLIIVHLMQNWGIIILQTHMPTYLSSALKIKIESNGYLSALPYFVNWILMIIFAWLSDYINKNNLMSRTNQRKMWNTVAHWGGALALMPLYLFDTSVTEAIVLLTTTMAVNSGVYTGFFTNHLDLAPNFAGTLLGITNTVASVTAILGPLLVGFIVADPSDKNQWGIVFLTSAIFFFIGNLFYIIYGSANIQDWNEPQNKIKKQSEDGDKNP